MLSVNTLISRQISLLMFVFMASLIDLPLYHLFFAPKPWSTPIVECIPISLECHSLVRLVCPFLICVSSCLYVLYLGLVCCVTSLYVAVLVKVCMPLLLYCFITCLLCSNFFMLLPSQTWSLISPLLWPW